MAIRRLVLIDGHAVMYRSFYGIPDLSTAGGRPTNAVFGFIRMIRLMRQKLQPSHMIVVFDGGMPLRRLALLDTYKAQRPSMPEALRGQFAIAEEYLQKAQIPWLRIPSEEGDDVIATLARKAEVDGSDVLIVTNDKDMYQLVNEHTRMVPPSDTDKIMAIEEIRVKTGVVPERIIEWLALIGDASDNIDGVPGVGPKTAAKLLAQYGSVDGIFKGLAAVKSPGIRSALEQSRDIVMRNIELIRLSCDLACAPDWTASEVKAENQEVLRPFLKGLELNSLMKEWEVKREKNILTLDDSGRCDTIDFNFD